MITDERLKEIWDELEEAILYGDTTVFNIDEFREQQQLVDELLTSRQTIKQLIEAIVSVQELDHCVYYDSALATLKHSNPELAKQIFDEHKAEWDYTEWENV